MFGAIAVFTLAAMAASGPSLERTAPASRLVFASARTGVSQLYSIRSTGGPFAQLTFGPREWCFPVPSPDGRYVAAIRAAGTDGCFSGEIWTMRADGRRPRRVAPAGYEISWKGDSRRLAYASGAGIRSVSVTGSARARLTPGPEDRLAGWSPDGRTLAFLRPTPDAGWALVVRRGAAERVVAENVSAAAWSPGGAWLAFTSTSGLELVRPDGTRRRTLVAATSTPFGAAPAWSPNGRLVAFSDFEAVRLVDVRAGRAAVLSPQRATELAWSPDGTSVAYVPGRGGVHVVSLGGSSRQLVPALAGDEIQGLGWSRVPARLRFRSAEAVPEIFEGVGRELRARAAIGPISADGDRVAFSACPSRLLAVWRPGEGVTPLGPTYASACRQTGSVRVLYNLALAGDRAAYMTREGGIQIRYTLMLTSVERRDAGIAVADGATCCAGSPLQPPVGYVLGSESLLIFSTWEAEQRAQTVWRIDAPGGTPRCTETGRCTAIGVSREGTYEPLAVDGGRIVVRRWDGLLDVLDSQGGRLRIIHPALGQVLGAELSGDDLVVLVRGQLQHYSASTGALLRAWPLPDVTSGGYCGRLYCPPAPELVLDDAGRGLVVYRLRGAVHLLRLRDGADVVVPGALQAELEESGLFAVYAGEPPWPGRIRFVPFDELPLR